MPAQRIETSDGISWHIETFRSSENTSTASGEEHIVLIPSGEGDCHNLTNVAQLLTSRNPTYRVLTFDMPGFSRTSAPILAYTNVTSKLLADQIISLLDKLDIQRATFFGCSSGGIATLALCEFYPSRVKCGIVHEVPFEAPPFFKDLGKMRDEEIIAVCRELYGKGFIEQDVNDGPRKWEELGSEYRERLARNYPIWIRGYSGLVDVPPPMPEALLQRPLFWTVGALNPGAKEGVGNWESDFRIAKEAGLKIDVERLHCLHFPSVTVPEELSDWIGECVEAVKD